MIESGLGKVPRSPTEVPDLYRCCRPKSMYALLLPEECVSPHPPHLLAHKIIYTEGKKKKKKEKSWKATWQTVTSHLTGKSIWKVEQLTYLCSTFLGTRDLQKSGLKDKKGTHSKFNHVWRAKLYSTDAKWSFFEANCTASINMARKWLEINHCSFSLFTPTVLYEY